MSTMRAAALKNNVFEVGALARPEPGPGEVLVKVRACGICGSDLHYFKHQKDKLHAGLSLNLWRRYQTYQPALKIELWLTPRGKYMRE